MVNYGLLSVLPPLLALICAICTRRILLALAVGIFAGASILVGGNPLLAILYFIEQCLFTQLSQPSKGQILVTILVIGGFVNLLDGSGGSRAFAEWIIHRVKGRKQAQIATWCGGLGIFFTDSGNSLILGPLFQPVFDKLKICREKLAYIIDSTASPVCVLIPFISWGVYIGSLIKGAYEQIGIKANSFEELIKAIPFGFYPILALLTVPLIILSDREFGPMARLQKNIGKAKISQIEEQDYISPRIILLPMATLLLSMIGLFTFHYLALGKLPGSKIRVSLVVSYLCGAFVCAFLLRRYRVKSLQESSLLFRQGAEKMLMITVILVFAWALGKVCKELGTGAYLAGLSKDFLTPALLPASIFILGALISFATGSSWGTFAILMPLAIPVAHNMDVSLYTIIGAVISGGLFGDHTSPISDTTLLASLGAGCQHIDHVRTQFAYAFVTAVSAVTAFLLVGYLGYAITLLVSMLLLIALIFFLSRRYGLQCGQ